MPPLPVLSGREVVAALEKFGWRVARRQSSHIVLVKEGHLATLSVPDHKEVARGTLRGRALAVCHNLNGIQSRTKRACHLSGAPMPSIRWPREPSIWADSD